MSTSSRVVTVRDRLVTLLSGALPDTFVTRAFNPDQQRDEVVMLGDVRNGRHEIPTMRAGRKSRDESFDVEVLVLVQRSGEDSGPAESRAMDLMAELEDVLAEDPTLSLGDPTLRATLAEFDLRVGADGHRTWSVYMTVVVHVEVRLT